jgi:Flp pilus assembly protein TadG
MARRRKFRSGERGQVLILFALSLVILLLFVGLAIDFGLAYVTKADLGKAVDAAVLTGAKNTGLGQAGYTPVATSAFFMNYGNTNRDVVGTPVITVCGNSCTSGTSCGTGTTCPTDSLGNTLLTVSATSTVNTYFIGILPAFKTLNVSATAEARYARVQMTLVIDRTGSMNTNAPGSALPSAMTTFIDDFDNVNDSVAMISFANDETLDVPFNAVAHPGVTGNFQTQIITAINAMPARFNGDTYTDGALAAGSPNAITEEAINLGLSPNTNVVHVVVFFTDGNANTVQNALACAVSPDPAGTTLNFGGYDPPYNTTVGFLVPQTNYTELCQETGSNSCCASPKNTFPSQSQGANVAINWANVNQDALFRSVADANAMRATVPHPTIVYAVGLHGGAGVLNDLFLCEIANDPGAFCAGLGFFFNPNTPQGLYAPASDYTQLTAAFQEIASNIRLRLLN